MFGISVAVIVITKDEAKQHKAAARGGEGADKVGASGIPSPHRYATQRNTEVTEKTAHNYNNTARNTLHATLKRR